MQEIILIALMLMTSLSFVVALVSLLMALRLGKGVVIAVKVDNAAQTPPKLDQMSYEDLEKMAKEVISKAEKEHPQSQVNLDPLIASLQDFMNGGPTNV